MISNSTTNIKMEDIESEAVSTSECVSCHQTTINNGTLRLMASICMHRFCETCINKAFLNNQQSYICPKCKADLKKGTFKGVKEDEDKEY